ncbi:hypothetical protein [Candidatus Lokiarchaeum ossiferum]|uniref:hypothetical protein n=1 Tax=Candidatus Lokiarchaeum ossiferum TaxID=2951803 RepID=UPI00352FE6C4
MKSTEFETHKLKFKPNVVYFIRHGTVEWGFIFQDDDQMHDNFGNADFIVDVLFKLKENRKYVYGILSVIFL